MRKIVLVAAQIMLVFALLSSCAPAAAPSSEPIPTKESPVATAAVPTPVPVGSTRTPATDKPSYGGVLKTFGTVDFSHYDLHQVISNQELHPLAPAYSLLVRSDPKDINTLVPDLAERWEASPDGKVYTFYLRRGVKFHDGTSLTSSDVKASFERITSPPKGVLSARQAYFDAVDKIEAPDEYTVKFVLKRVQAAFPSIVSVPFNAVFPKAVLDKKGDMKKDMVGTGPFRFKEYIRGVQLVVEKNTDYFIGGQPYLDGIVRYIIPDVSTAKGAFKAGRLDLMQPSLYYTEAELKEWRKHTPDMVVPKVMGSTLYAFIPNNAKKPWNDVRVRRAALLALDKDALLERHLVVGARGGYMPPGPWAIPNDELLKLPGWGKNTPEDLTEAKRLLAEAGYPNGFTTRFLERSTAAYLDQAISLKGQMVKVGINLDLDIRESAAYLAVKRTPDFETMGEAAVNVEMGEPDIILTRYLSGFSGNYSQYKNPKVDQLYREQSQAMDPAERKKKVLEIQRIMMDDLPFVPWAWLGYYAIHSPRVKNYNLSGIFVGQSMDSVWLAGQ